VAAGPGLARVVVRIGRKGLAFAWQSRELSGVAQLADSSLNPRLDATES
jgi:hypothetical protein